MTTLAFNLSTLSQKRATGKLVVHAETQLSPQWCLYLHAGRLVYATNEYHRIRRWYRALKQYCPDYACDRHLSLQAGDGVEPWELQVLSQWVNQRNITVSQAWSTIHWCMHEVFFALSEQTFVASRWIPMATLPVPIAFLSADRVIHDACHLQKQWRSRNLARLQELLAVSPDLAPVLQANADRRLIPFDLQGHLERLTTGQNTLWDIAVDLRRPLPAIARMLMPLLLSEGLVLREVPDLAVPVLALVS